MSNPELVGLWQRLSRSELSLSGHRSWINVQREIMKGKIRHSPSLKHVPAQELARSYRIGRMKAADQTGLPEKTFPTECPYALTDIMDHNFRPGPREPWLA